MHRKLPILLVVCAFALAIGLAACGDDDETTTAASETTTAETTTGEDTTTGEQTTAGGGGGGGETVDISETEFKIDPSDVTTKAGKVTFAIKNDGSVDHNLEVEGNGVEEVSDTIGGGQSTELAVDLKPGTYEMYCAIDDHKGLGMEGEITVE